MTPNESRTAKMRHIYLDHNSTTPVRKEVMDAMMPYFSEEYANASSIHSMGQSARKAVESAREIIGNTIGTESVDIVFTSGGTEADNFAIKGTAIANLNKGRHIITTEIEHLAVLESCWFLEEQLGFEVTYLPVDKYGVVDLNRLKESIREDTTLISVMFANNETGTLQPVKEIAKIAKTKGICFHTDAVQALGKEPIDVEEIGADLCSFSAHKLYGPKGIGALYVRKAVNILPFQNGGHQERNRRGGTLNVPGIAGFAKAVELAVKDMNRTDKYLRNLTDRFLKGLYKEIKDIYLNGHPKCRLSNTLNISFKDVEGESLIVNLDLKSISVSTGSACASGSLDPSHVLTAMQVPPDLARASIRFSFGYENTEEDVEYCLKEIPAIVKKLRNMPPLC